MQRYVMGLLFNDDGSRVALIHKKKGPPNVIDKWNGIGGKVEDGETSLAAIRREFFEEAGVDLIDWNLFLTIGDDESWTMDVFVAFNSLDIYSVRSMEEEDVSVWHTEGLPRVVSNLKWIIPMARESYNYSLNYEVIERTM